MYETEGEYFYKRIAENIKNGLDTSGFLKDGNSPLPVGKNEKLIGMIKDELSGNIMTEFVQLWALNREHDEGLLQANGRPMLYIGYRYLI